MTCWHFGERKPENGKLGKAAVQPSPFVVPRHVSGHAQSCTQTYQFSVLKENRMAGLVPPPPVYEEINLLIPARVRASMCAHYCVPIPTVLPMLWGQVPTLRDLLLERSWSQMSSSILKELCLPGWGWPWIYSADGPSTSQCSPGTS